MKNYLNIGLIVCLAIFMLSGFVYLNDKIGKKVAVVNLEKMYSSFDMTKAYNTKYQNLSQPQNYALDSLQNVLASTDLSIDNMKLIHIQKTIQVLSQQKETMKFELEQQIWSQLNQYVSDFGKISDYALIQSTSNDGSVLFAEQTVDITEEIVSFINKKYKGVL